MTSATRSAAPPAAAPLVAVMCVALLAPSCAAHDTSTRAPAAARRFLQAAPSTSTASTASPSSTADVSSSTLAAIASAAAADFPFVRPAPAPAAARGLLAAGVGTATRRRLRGSHFLAAYTPLGRFFPELFTGGLPELPKVGRWFAEARDGGDGTAIMVRRCG
jgi:hypothetical protein